MKRVILFTVLAWFIFILDLILPVSITDLGIVPRAGRGLIGIGTAPFLHGNFWHLLSNTFPFLILSVFLFTFYKPVAFKVMLVIILIAGSITWIFAPAQTIHIGASGVVFGLVGFLIFAAFFSKRILPLFASLLTLLLYGFPLLYGLLPIHWGVSYTSHWGGFVGGILAAYWYARKR